MRRAFAGITRGLVVPAVLFATGCMGQFGTSSPTGNGNGNGTGDGSDGVDGLSSTAKAAVQGVFLRRLSKVEYVHSVRDLLGDIPDKFGGNAPSDEIVNGFDNNAENASFSDTRLTFYRTAAAQAADFALSPTRRAAFVGCDPVADKTCVPSFVTRFGKRAFRRPLTAEEVKALAAVGDVAATDPDPYMPLRLILEAALRSSDFLYRPEIGTSKATADGLIKLSGYEIATRLSYLVLSTTPSDTLLDAAARGALDSADGVEAQLTSLLALPNAQPELRRFFQSWLGLNNLKNITRDASNYPRWNPAIADAMREETLRVLEELAWTPGQSILDVLTSRFTYVNPALSAFYGLPDTNGKPDSWTRVAFANDSPRGGLLTQGSILTANAADHEVLTVIRRGNWVRGVVMCAPLPPPPPDVPPLSPSVSGQSIRDQLASHRENLACSGCHDKMDPIGFGLSGFDEVGLPRTKDSTGNAVDTSGAFLDLKQGGSFQGPLDMAAALRTMPQVSDCFVQQVFRYTFGRSATLEDQGTIDSLEETFNQNGSAFLPLLTAFVRSNPFRFSRTDTKAAGGKP